MSGFVHPQSAPTNRNDSSVATLLLLAWLLLSSILVVMLVFLNSWVVYIEIHCINLNS